MDKRKSESSTLGKRVIKIFVLGIQAILVLLLLICAGSRNTYAQEDSGTISITSPANGARITSANLDVAISYSANYKDGAITFRLFCGEDSCDYSSLPVSDSSGKRSYRFNLADKPASQYVVEVTLESSDHGINSKYIDEKIGFVMQNHLRSTLATAQVTINYDPQPTINPINDLTPQTGGIYILSNPQGALIFLNPDAPDGYSGTRTTPDERLGLRPGNYTVTLKKAGYPDTSKQAQIKAGNVTTVEISLVQAEPDSDPLPVIVGVVGAAAVIGLVGKMITGKKPMPVRTPVRTPVIPRPPTKPAVPRPPNILRDEWAKQAEQQKKLREELMKAREKAEADKKAAEEAKKAREKAEADKKAAEEEKKKQEEEAAKKKKEEAKAKKKAEIAQKYSDLVSDLRDELAKLTDRGYYISDPGNSKISYLWATTARNVWPIGDSYLRGFTCGQLTDREKPMIEALVKKHFGSEAILDTIIIQEQYTDGGTAKMGRIEEAITYNHIAYRVILPDGRAKIIDFWQALQKGPLIEEEGAFIKKFKGNMGFAAHYNVGTGTGGQSATMEFDYNNIAKNTPLESDAVKIFETQSPTKYPGQAQQLETYLRYLKTRITGHLYTKY